MRYKIVTLTRSELNSVDGRIVQVLKTEFLGDTYPLKLCCLIEKETNRERKDK